MIDTSFIEAFFEQGLLVGGLALVSYVLWRAFSKQNENVIKLVEKTTEVIAKNSSSFDLLEKLIEKWQLMTNEKESSNQQYWKEKIGNQDKQLEEIKSILISVKNNLTENKKA